MSNGILIEHNGEAHTLKEWSKIVGISYCTLCERYKKGYRGEILLTKARTRNCKICGKEFTTETYSVKCCSPECRKVNVKINKELYRERQKMQPKKPKKEKKLTVTDMAAKARELGMSYGQYTAMLWLQERKVQSEG